MGVFFTIGEKKDRPGVYQRYENRGTGPLAGIVNGIVAAVYKSNWGPVGEVETIGSDEAGGLTARMGGGANATVDVVTEAFNGGATTVLAVRLGSGGTQGTLALKDTTADTPADAIKLTTKYPGSRSFKITIREKLGDTPLLFTFRTKKEGGVHEMDTAAYVALNKAVAATKMADLIDVEETVSSFV